MSSRKEPAVRSSTGRTATVDVPRSRPPAPSLLLVVAVAIAAATMTSVSAQDWYKYNSISNYYGQDKLRRRCLEKSMQAREESANVIFTGTIRDLEPDWQHPDQMKARVEIKRVMKGGHVLSRLTADQGATAAGAATAGGGGESRHRMVTVDGIGDPAVCNSLARKLDTRIFLVNKGPNGELRLNSSLVRITLDNIEEAEAAVKGTW